MNSCSSVVVLINSLFCLLGVCVSKIWQIHCVRCYELIKTTSDSKLTSVIPQICILTHAMSEQQPKSSFDVCYNFSICQMFLSILCSRLNCALSANNKNLSRIQCEPLLSCSGPKLLGKQSNFPKGKTAVWTFISSCGSVSGRFYWAWPVNLPKQALREIN